MKLIINADDFGIARTANKAIIELCHKEVVTSTTVMANMPYANEIVNLLPFGNISIGLHVNLTQGPSVSDPFIIHSIVDEHGNFFPKMVLKNKIQMGQIKKDHILTEIRAQFKLLHGLVGDRLDHFDSHQGLNKIKLVSEGLIQIAKETKRKWGIRVYNKYYLKGESQNPKFVNPRLINLVEFGLKRIAIETVLRQRTKRLHRYFYHPDGLVMTPSHLTLDFFKQLMEIETTFLPDYILEAACHPATGVNDLPETTMKESRIKEYELLKSEAFIKATRRINMINYSGILY
ncbi:MAG: ChbG/HpnK family deacetylase [Bacteroidales bacterium]|nr:ChbG/HpnK family deacetylase [Bacteroidales bacterium]